MIIQIIFEINDSVSNIIAFKVIFKLLCIIILFVRAEINRPDFNIEKKNSIHRVGRMTVSFTFKIIEFMMIIK